MLSNGITFRNGKHTASKTWERPGGGRHGRFTPGSEIDLRKCVTPPPDIRLGGIHTPAGRPSACLNDELEEVENECRFVQIQHGLGRDFDTRAGEGGRGHDDIGLKRSRKPTAITAVPIEPARARGTGTKHADGLMRSFRTDRSNRSA